MLQYAKVRDQDISNGPGFRVSIFFQGCIHHCNNCFNPETWDPNKGFILSKSKQETIIELCNNNKISGLSLLGGDPLFYFDITRLSFINNSSLEWKHDMNQIIDFVKEFKIKYPNKTIWLWTGYKWEQMIDRSFGLLHTQLLIKFLQYIDVVVDGLFVEKLKVPNLLWRGSTNQRIIDVQKSLLYNKLILLTK